MTLFKRVEHLIQPNYVRPETTEFDYNCLICGANFQSSVIASHHVTLHGAKVDVLTMITRS